MASCELSEACPCKGQTDSRAWPCWQAGAHSLLWLSLSKKASRCRGRLLHKWLLLAAAAEIPAGSVRGLITAREGSMRAANFSWNLCPHLAALLPCARCSGNWALCKQESSFWFTNDRQKNHPGISLGASLWWLVCIIAACKFFCFKSNYPERSEETFSFWLLF